MADLWKQPFGDLQQQHINHKILGGVRLAGLDRMRVTLKVSLKVR